VLRLLIDLSIRILFLSKSIIIIVAIIAIFIRDRFAQDLTGTLFQIQKTLKSANLNTLSFHRKLLGLDTQSCIPLYNKQSTPSKIPLFGGNCAFDSAPEGYLQRLSLFGCAALFSHCASESIFKETGAMRIFDLFIFFNPKKGGQV
jgi:hypothetical protein